MSYRRAQMYCAFSCSTSASSSSRSLMDFSSLSSSLRASLKWVSRLKTDLTPEMHSATLPPMPSSLSMSCFSCVAFRKNCATNKHDRGEMVWVCREEKNTYCFEVHSERPAHQQH